MGDMRPNGSPCSAGGLDRPVASPTVSLAGVLCTAATACSARLARPAPPLRLPWPEIVLTGATEAVVGGVTADDDGGPPSAMVDTLAQEPLERLRRIQESRRCEPTEDRLDPVLTLVTTSVRPTRVAGAAWTVGPAGLAMPVEPATGFAMAACPGRSGHVIRCLRPAGGAFGAAPTLVARAALMANDWDGQGWP